MKTSLDKGSFFHYYVPLFAIPANLPTSNFTGEAKRALGRNGPLKELRMKAISRLELTDVFQFTGRYTKQHPNTYVSENGKLRLCDYQSPGRFKVASRYPPIDFPQGALFVDVVGAIVD